MWYTPFFPERIVAPDSLSFSLEIIGTITGSKTPKLMGLTIQDSSFLSEYLLPGDIIVVEQAEEDVKSGKLVLETTGNESIIGFCFKDEGGFQFKSSPYSKTGLLHEIKRRSFQETQIWGIIHGSMRILSAIEKRRGLFFYLFKISMRKKRLRLSDIESNKPPKSLSSLIALAIAPSKVSITATLIKILRQDARSLCVIPFRVSADNLKIIKRPIVKPIAVMTFYFKHIEQLVSNYESEELHFLDKLKCIDDSPAAIQY
ncbi:hypothetical protein ACTFIW_005508 [Dictyostelium discoideum]